MVLKIYYYFFIEIKNDVWNSVNNSTEILSRSVIWLLMHLNLRLSFYKALIPQKGKKDWVIVEIWGGKFNLQNWEFILL